MAEGGIMYETEGECIICLRLLLYCLSAVTNPLMQY